MTVDEFQEAIKNEGGPRHLLRFLAFGGDVNARLADSGSTLLHLAVEYDNLPMIRALVEAGADIEAREASGWTPLHHAVDLDVDSAGQRAGPAEGDFMRALRFSTTELLISLGADTEAQRADGLTPRDMAACYGEEVVRKYDEAVANAIGR